MGRYDRLVEDEKKSRVYPPESPASQPLERPRKARRAKPGTSMPQIRGIDKDASNFAIMLSEVMADKIRRIMGTVGKEVVFLRVSDEEKERMDKIVNGILKSKLKGKIHSVSGNTLARLALNIMLEDYEENKNKSLLAKMLAKMVE